MQTNRRFSFASSVVVRDASGRYLLIVNKHALQARGELLLTPVGGKVGIDPQDEYLFTRHGAVFASKVAPDVNTASLIELAAHKFDPPMTDLVFHGPTTSEELFRELFVKRFAAYDYAAKREMHEELVDETRTLRSKDLRHLFWETLPFSHVGEERAQSARAGGQETLRLMSFFDVNLTVTAQRRLERRARRRPLGQRIVAWTRRQYTGALVYFATREEIETGHTFAEGAKIASIAKTMLR